MVSRYVEVGRVGKANQYIVNRLSLELWCRNLVGVSYTKRRFKRRWRSAPVGQEFQSKTCQHGYLRQGMICQRR